MVGMRSSCVGVLPILFARPVSFHEASIFASVGWTGTSNTAFVFAYKGVLHAITLAKRSRAWEARDLLDLMNDVERELATADDTYGPGRPTPRARTNSRRR